MVFHTSADLGPGEHPYACFSAESRPLTSAYIARVRVDRSMNSIEAQGVKTVPGHLLMMRWAEEETANQCSNTKESTGAPVSASEQDSHTRVTGKREEVVTFDYGINELEQPTVHS